MRESYMERTANIPWRVVVKQVQSNPISCVQRPNEETWRERLVDSYLSVSNRGETFRGGAKSLVWWECRLAQWLTLQPMQHPNLFNTYCNNMVTTLMQLWHLQKYQFFNQSKLKMDTLARLIYFDNETKKLIPCVWHQKQLHIEKRLQNLH